MSAGSDRGQRWRRCRIAVAAMACQIELDRSAFSIMSAMLSAGSCLEHFRTGPNRPRVGDSESPQIPIQGAGWEEIGRAHV